jgi:DNA-binding response OmpR family regulator
MQRYHFKDVSLVLVEANRDIRGSIRASLMLEGFGEVHDTHLLDRARGWVEASPPDLLIADAQSFETESCGLFHGIRHQVLGEDPFVPIIALSGPGLPPQVKKVIDSGVDHILVRPVTIESLLDRILLLIRKRKPFVVTSDYIGPDRRTEMRAGEQVPLIQVPNALRAKATKSADAAALRAEIHCAKAEINRRKMERNAVQIAWLTAHIVEGGQAVRTEHLERLLETAQDLARRLEGTRQDHVSGLCRSLVQVAAKLLRVDSDTDPRDIRVLPHLSAAIVAAFPADGHTAAVAEDICRSVARLANE